MTYETLGAEPRGGPCDRIPVALRLGEQSVSPKIKGRTPASQRLGLAETAKAMMIPLNEKRKPCRPPGRKTKQMSPLIKGSNAKKRKTQSAKPPVGRRKINNEETRGALKQSTGLSRGEASRPAGSAGNSQSSDNIPLSKMVPRSSRKRTDFRIPSAPAP